LADGGLVGHQVSFVSLFWAFWDRVYLFAVFVADGLANAAVVLFAAS
jgi:hypothetical protein